MEPSKTPVQLIREMQALRAAAYQYQAEHDRFEAQSLMHAMLGNWAEAEGAHQYALLCLRAYRAEVDDPEVTHA